MVAVHCGHGAAELGSIAERTRSISCVRRLLGALSTRVAALVSLIVNGTVEVGVRVTPRRSVAVLTA